MANSFIRYTGNGSTDTYAVSFPYRSQSDITVTIDGVATTAFTWNGAGTQITFTSPPGNLTSIQIKRTTSQTSRLVDYAAGSVLTENDLDTDSTQAFYIGQEAVDEANDRIVFDVADFQWDAGSKRIKNVANPTANQDAVTKYYLENTWLSTADKANLTSVAGVASEIALLGTTDAIADMNTLGTTAIVADLDAVADKVTEIGRLGTADAVADLAILGTSAIVTDLDLLGTSAVVTDMDLLATSGNVTNMATLGASGVVTNIATVAGQITPANNISTLAGISADITAVANISSDIADVQDKLAEIETAADDLNEATSEIDTVAGAITNIDLVGNAIANVNLVGGQISPTNNISTVATNIVGVTSFAERYRVGATNPTGSLDAGDLFFNTGDSTLKYYSGSTWASITAGIGSIADDTTPQLGGDLDLNGNSIDFPTTPNISDVLDEDAMGSDSATALATQQSIKAYVDAVEASDITTVGTFFSNWNSITSNLTSTLTTLKNRFVAGEIDVVTPAIWTIGGSGELTIL